MKAKKREEGSREKEAGEEEEEVATTGGASLRLAGMVRLKRAVGVILLLSSSTAAHAVSITNRDDTRSQGDGHRG